MVHGRQLSRHRRLAGAIAELAIECDGRKKFRGELIALLREQLQFDLATVMSTPDGVTATIDAPGFDPVFRAERIFEYMGQFRQGELSRAMNGVMAIDVELMTADRCRQLSMYREVLRPNQVRVFGASIWKNRFGVFALGVARTDRSCFRASDMEIVNRALPVVQLAEASFSAWGTPAPASQVRKPALKGLGLSAREQEITALVARGLQNKEIAGILRTSPFTVRNQLASVFRKLDVSTRAELIFALGSSSSGRRGEAASPVTKATGSPQRSSQ